MIYISIQVLYITLATSGFVFLGQGLRDILDPRLKR